VTENACTELESGACRGHHYHLQLVELIDAGLIERVRLGAADVAIYESSSMARRTIISAIEELNAASASHAERRKAGRGPDPVPTVLASPDVAERRQLTVMFCDLVGSTALSSPSSWAMGYSHILAFRAPMSRHQPKHNLRAIHAPTPIR
jgi:hypothetical protein